MSLTQAEREQWRLEINRLNAQGWAEDTRMRVQAIQSANPGMSFETAWNQADRERLHPAPEPTDIGSAAKLVHAQNPTWTFERSWNHAVAVYPQFVRARKEEPRDPGTPKDPQVAQEMAKHKKLSDSRQSASAGEHADRLAKIRKLMSENPKLSFDAAFTQICQQENAAKAAPATATLTRTTSVSTVVPKPRMMLIKGHEASYVD
jgi:hypothetical protein